MIDATETAALRRDARCLALSKRTGIGVFAAGALVLLTAFAAGAAAPVPADGAADEHHLFGEVFQNIVNYHIDETHPQALALAGLQALAAIDPTLAVAQSGAEATLRSGDAVKFFAAPALDDSAGWGDLTATLLDAARSASPAVAAVPPDELDEKVIDAALATLDPFSRYVRPAVARERRAERDGFNGIGITVDLHDTQIRIASVQPDTPAATAGLQADDRILSVDGVASATLSLAQLRRRLRGKPDTVVVLAIARGAAAQPRTLSIPRAHIVIPAVTLETKDGIAWLKVAAFNQQTGELAAALLGHAHRQLGTDLHGIILDLRNDPGGLLDQSIDLASLFLKGVPVASTIGRLPESFQNFTAPADDNPETLPLAVLVNGGSASASEIVASALQDARRAVVIGSSSYGKGTVQTVIRTSNDGELTVTWAQLITPLGYHLNHHGVVPNICTVDVRDDGPSVATLTRALADAPEEPRDRLDDAGWTSLRTACPTQRTERTVDFDVARRLLDDPLLYNRALASAPAAVMRTSEARVTP